MREPEADSVWVSIHSRLASVTGMKNLHSLVAFAKTHRWHCYRNRCFIFSVRVSWPKLIESDRTNGRDDVVTNNEIKPHRSSYIGATDEYLPFLFPFWFAPLNTTYIIMGLIYSLECLHMNMGLIYSLECLHINMGLISSLECNHINMGLFTPLTTPISTWVWFPPLNISISLYVWFPPLNTSISTYRSTNLICSFEYIFIDMDFICSLEYIQSNTGLIWSADKFGGRWNRVCCRDRNVYERDYSKVGCFEPKGADRGGN